MFTINEFSQAAVIMTITYCYTGDYIDVSISDYAGQNSLSLPAAYISVLRKKFTDGLRLQRIVEESGEIQDKLKANIQVLALAQKYEFNSLSTLAMTRLERLRNAPSFIEDLCKVINELVDSPSSSLLLGVPLAKLCLPFVSKLKRNSSFLKAMAKSGEFLTHLWVLDEEDTHSVEICGASATVNGVGQEWKTRYFLKRVGDQNVLVAKTPQQNGRYEFSGEIPISSDQPLDKFAQELKVKNNIKAPERPILYKSPIKELMGT